MIRRWVLILCCFLIYSVEAFSSDTLQNPSSIAIKPQYGLILPHSSKVEHLTHTNPFGFELEYSWLMIKDRNYRQCNCYSKTGLSFLYINYANPDIVGSSYSLIGFAEPFFFHTKRIFLGTRMGFGVSYLDKIYDETDNPQNTFFSTHLSFIVHIDLNVYYKFNEHWNAFLFAKYNHISNGGVKKPNYGMNFPTFGLGAEYYPFQNRDFPHRQKREFQPDWFFNFYSFGMTKTIESTNVFPETTTLVYGFYGAAGRTISILNALSAGAEFLMDGAAKERIKRQNLSTDHKQFSFLIGHHLLFGRFDFSQQWGTYIYAPYQARNFYQRYSLSYKFTKRLMAGATLKAHGDAADSIHILIGISL